MLHESYKNRDDHCGLLELVLSDLSEKNESNLSGVGNPETDRECPACTRNTARLLTESSFYDFYYCFNCREWSKGRYPNPKTIFLVRDIRLSRALTRFYIWKLELAQGMNLGNSLQSIWRRLRPAPSLDGG